MMTKNTRRFEFKLGRIGLIFFLLGISGLLFGVFLLGVTVGKNIDTYPEKIARFLPDRIRTLISRMSQDATAPAVAMRDDLKQEKPEPNMDLTFYDSLGKQKADPKGTAPDGMILQKAPAAAVKEKALTAVGDGSNRWTMVHADDLAEAYLHDRKSVLPAAAFLEGEYGLSGLYVGVPVQLGAGGVEKVFEIALTADEKQAVAVSASHVKELVEATARVLA